jgi:hypothetical protein
LDKAKTQTTPEARADIFKQAIKWMESARGKSGETLMTIDDLANLKQFERLSDSKLIGSFLRNAQEIGSNGGLNAKVEKALEQMSALRFIDEIAGQTNNFTNYSKLGEAISDITSVEKLNAVLMLVGDDPELTGTIGHEILRGVVERNSKNIFVPGGKINEDGVRAMTNGILNDIDRIGGANKGEIYQRLFGSTKVAFLDGTETTLANHISRIEEFLQTMTDVEMHTTAGVMKAAHGITSILYSFTGKGVPAIYHAGQFVKMQKAQKDMSVSLADLGDIIRNISAEGWGLKESRLFKVGDAMKKNVQNFSYPSLTGAYTLDETMKGAMEMLGVDSLTDEQKQEIKQEYNAQ